MITFADFLQNWLSSRSMTPKQGQVWAGIPQRTWEDWQTGRTVPPTRRGQQVARALAGKLPPLPSSPLEAAKRLLAIGDAEILSHYLAPSQLGKTRTRLAVLDNRGTLAEIARRYGIKANVALLALRRFGLQPTERGFRPLTDEERAARAERRAVLLPLRRKKLGMALSTARVDNEKQRRKIEIISDMLLNGKSLTAIAADMGCSLSALSHYITRHRTY